MKKDVQVIFSRNLQNTATEIVKSKTGCEKIFEVVKKHVAVFNPAYSVHTNLTVITLNEKVFDSILVKAMFDYKVGVFKKLYMLILLHRDMERVIEWLKDNELSPFADDEYMMVQTPEPDNAAIKTCRKVAEERWTLCAPFFEFSLKTLVV